METDQTQTDDVADEIENTREEIETRRTREQERHSERMEEIEQAEAEAMDELAEQAGVVMLEDVHADIGELRDDIYAQQKALKKYVGRVINKGLPTGGYKETITIRDNWVYKYNKRRNASYPLERVLTHDLIEELIGAHYSDVEAQQWMLAFSQLDEHASRLDPSGAKYSKHSWGRTVNLDADDPDDWHTIGIKFICASYVRKGSTDYLIFKDDPDKSRYNSNSLKFQLPTRDPEHLELLAQHQSEIHDSLLDLKRELEDEKESNEELFAEVTDLIPVEVEENYRL